MGKKKSRDEIEKEKSQEYYKCEERLKSKFSTLMKENGFINNEKYTNEKAMCRLDLLITLIDSFFAENISEKIFDKKKGNFNYNEIWEKFNKDQVHIDEQLNVPNIVTYRDDNGELKEKEDYDVYEFESDLFAGISRRILKSYNKFNSIYSDTKKKLMVLRQGVIGEKSLYNRLSIIGDKIRIIQNARYIIDDDFGVEHDMIVISPYGIFSIEIKNWGSDSYLNNKGFLVSKNGKRINVIEQSMRHVHNLERLIQKELYHEAKVFPLIVWVNEKSRIKNDFKYVTVCNYNDVEFELFNSEKYTQIYSKEDVDAIYKKLLELRKPVNTYPLDIDIEGLSSAIPSLIAGLNCLPNMADMDRESKLSENVIDRILRIMLNVAEIIDRLA